MSFDSLSPNSGGNNSFRTGFTADFLKFFALLSMTVDHAAIAVVGALMRRDPMFDTFNKILGNADATQEELASISADYMQLHEIYTIMRLIGRFAFPIFAFLIYQGFLHTNSIKKYMIRLGVCAVIAEVPFNLLSSFDETGKMSFFYPLHQNTLFSLLLCLATLFIMQKLEKEVVTPTAAMFLMLKQFAIVVVACLIASIGRFDYAFVGPLFVAVLYFCKDKKGLQLLLGGIVLIYTGNIYTLLALLPIGFYNDLRLKSPKLKYFFYIYYPLHLAVLAAISYFLIG